MSLDFGNSLLTQERRKEIADKIVKLLNPHLEKMEEHERKFVQTLFTKYCTTKQLQWLQSLQEKYD